MRYPDQYIKLPDTVKTIHAIGDIHGEFLSCINDLTESCKLKDAAVIVCGDIGMGFNSPNWYISMFHKLEMRIAERNLYLICFRGNHDDPSYFVYKENDELTKRFPHIILAEDFTIVEAADQYKILLWGGARSIDKVNRLEGYSYWSGEMPKELPEKFKENGFDLNCVCSHTCPSFCFPITKGGVAEWAKYDNVLLEDCEKERQYLTEGCQHLMINNPFTLELWCYGHFHDTIWNYSYANDELYRYSKCQFIGLDMFRNSSYDRKNIVGKRYGIFNREHANDIIKIHTVVLRNSYAKEQ